MIPPVMIRNEVQTDIHRVFGDQTYKFDEDNLNSGFHTGFNKYVQETQENQTISSSISSVGYLLKISIERPILQTI